MDSDVDFIWKEYKKGKSIEDIAREHGYGGGYVNDLINQAIRWGKK